MFPNIDSKDAKGHAVYKCDVCSKTFDIFGMNFYRSANAQICHVCQIKAAIRACNNAKARKL